ncbi:GTP-binding protein [Nocardiopsis sp. JB363]|uniref:CobW family GTP-binding protein n=1 Tax=Nocardiopsis sp. JB363 TaxID=1434837 RepID=UPI00097B271B|nr:GTP-binding protein [Nocardiopsis sp. JB363]SIO91052.1 Putative metal chaperone, involved in Zn homeostasis, GTPase of COG0523 family [Nocardiopsis sp. JB363]
MRIALVTGLHGSARQEAVNDLLAAVPRAIAVHHDMRDIGEGAVHRVVRDRSSPAESEQVDLDHVCASCTLREDLIPFLLRAAAGGRHDLCVVESWDGVEPRSIAESIAEQEELRLATVATAVDVDRLTTDLGCHDDLSDRRLDIAQDDTRTVAEVLGRQIEYPNVIVLRGARTARTHRQAQALIRQLNPAAAIAGSGTDLRDFLDAEFDPRAAHARTNPAWAQYAGHPEELGVITTAWTRTRPFHPERLAEALERIVGMILRGRGRFWLASQPDVLLVWDSHQDLLMVENGGPWMAALPDAAMDLVAPARRASALLDWNPRVGDRRQHLAFTGIGMDTGALLSLLESCLVTADEADQEFLNDPFAEFSER